MEVGEEEGEQESTQTVVGCLWFGGFGGLNTASITPSAMLFVCLF
jgi:hypothetical protein